MKFEWPKYFYQARRGNGSSSSRVARFRPEAAILGDSPYTSTIPPQSQKRHRAVVISAWQLAHANAEELCDYEMLFKGLLADKFPVYIVNNGKITELSSGVLSAELLKQLTPLPDAAVKKLMLDEYQLAASQLFVLDNKRLKKLKQELMPTSSTPTMDAVTIGVLLRAPEKLVAILKSGDVTEITLSLKELGKLLDIPGCEAVLSNGNFELSLSLAQGDTTEQLEKLLQKEKIINKLRKLDIHENHQVNSVQLQALVQKSRHLENFTSKKSLWICGYDGSDIDLDAVLLSELTSMALADCNFSSLRQLNGLLAKAPKLQQLALSGFLTGADFDVSARTATATFSCLTELSYSPMMMNEGAAAILAHVLGKATHLHTIHLGGKWYLPQDVLARAQLRLAEVRDLAVSGNSNLSSVIILLCVTTDLAHLKLDADLTIDTITSLPVTELSQLTELVVASNVSLAALKELLLRAPNLKKIEFTGDATLFNQLMADKQARSHLQKVASLSLPMDDVSKSAFLAMKNYLPALKECHFNVKQRVPKDIVKLGKAVGEKNIFPQLETVAVHAEALVQSEFFSFMRLFPTAKRFEFDSKPIVIKDLKQHVAEMPTRCNANIHARVEIAERFWSEPGIRDYYGLLEDESVALLMEHMPNIDDVIFGDVGYLHRVSSRAVNLPLFPATFEKMAYDLQRRGHTITYPALTVIDIRRAFRHVLHNEQEEFFNRMPLTPSLEHVKINSRLGSSALSRIATPKLITFEADEISINAFAQLMEGASNLTSLAVGDISGGKLDKTIVANLKLKKLMIGRESDRSGPHRRNDLKDLSVILAATPQLERLALCSVDYSNDSEYECRQLSKLSLVQVQHLDLVNVKIEQKQLAALMQALPNCQSLNLGNLEAGWRRPPHWEGEWSCPQVNTLKLSALSTLTPELLSKFPNLTVLDLSMAADRRVSSEQWELAAKALPSLRELRLFSLSDLPASVNFSNLTTLTVSEVDTMESIHQLAQRAPELTEITIGYHRYLCGRESDKVNEKITRVTLCTDDSLLPDEIEKVKKNFPNASITFAPSLPLPTIDKVNTDYDSPGSHYRSSPVRARIGNGRSLTAAADRMATEPRPNLLMARKIAIGGMVTAAVSSIFTGIAYASTTTSSAVAGGGGVAAGGGAAGGGAVAGGGGAAAGGLAASTILIDGGIVVGSCILIGVGVYYGRKYYRANARATVDHSNHVDHRLDIDTQFNASSGFDNREICRALNGDMPFQQIRAGIKRLALTEGSSNINLISGEISYEKANKVEFSIDSDAAQIDVVERQSDPAHNKYYVFDYDIALKAGVAIPLAGLTQYDRLECLHVYTTKKPQPNIELLFNKELNQYFLRSDSDINVQASYRLAIANRDVDAFLRREKSIEEPEILQLIKDIKYGFSTPLTTNDYGEFALHGVTESSPAADKLEAMYQQRQGACRHRAAVFIYQFEKLQKQRKIPANYKANYILSGDHAWVEIGLPNHGGRVMDWISVDLGGYPVGQLLNQGDAELVRLEQQRLCDALQNRIKQLKEMSHGLLEKLQAPLSDVVSPTPVKTTVFLEYGSTKSIIKPTQLLPLEAQVAALQSSTASGKNILIKVKSQSQLDKWRLLLKLRHENATTIDSFKACQIGRPSIRVEGSSWEIVKPPAGELVTCLGQTTPAQVVVDWSRFSPDEMVQVNSMIDHENRHLGDLKFPQQTVVIGLIIDDDEANHSALLADRSFTSRQHRTIVAEYSDQELDAALAQFGSGAMIESDSAASEQDAIELYGSPNWRGLLLGQCAYAEGKPVWQQGPLLEAIAAGKTDIIINNPPIDDRDFQCLLEDLRYGQPFYYLGRKIELPGPMTIRCHQGYDFTPYAAQVEQISYSEAIEGKHIITPATFERCLGNEYIDGDKLLQGPGLIAASQSEVVSLLITDTLSPLQWIGLLEQAKAHGKKLNLSLAANVSLPENFNLADAKRLNPATTQANKKSDFAALCDSKHSFVLRSNDDDFSAEVIAEKVKPSMVIDVSELSDEDLLFCNKFKLEEGRFVFHEQISDVLRALEQGDTVILKGHVSATLLDHLTTLLVAPATLWHQGQEKELTGRLIVVMDENSAAIPAFCAQAQVVVSSADKARRFAEKLPMADTRLNMAETFAKPWATIKHAVALANAYPECPLQKILHGQVDEGTSETWDTQNLDLSELAFQAFEESRFNKVANALATTPMVFIEGPAGSGKSSFIRELEKRDGHKIYREDELANWASNPQGGKIFVDEANTKNTHWTKFSGLFGVPPTIMIDGQSYSLTGQHKVIFAGNPLNYGGERELQKLLALHPHTIIFDALSPAYIHHKILKPILSLSFSGEELEEQSRQLFIAHKQVLQDKPEATVRDLQMAAMLVCANAELAAAKQQSPSSAAEIISGLSAVNAKVSASDFLITSSREVAAGQLTDLLKVRDFKRRHSEAADAVCYGGISSLLLYGEPGVGKSDLVKALLDSQGYKRVNVSDPAPSNTDRIYYHLTPEDLSQDISILQRAFNEGAIVIIDEINSVLIAEAYLNAFLMGETPSGERPVKSGFTLIGTANGADMEGRHVVSRAIQSRAYASTLAEYSPVEMRAIIKHKYPRIADLLIDAMVEDFMRAKQRAALDPTSPNPTFRDLQGKIKALDELVAKHHDITLDQLQRIYVKQQNKEFLTNVLLLVESNVSTPLAFFIAQGEIEKARQVLEILDPKQIVSTLSLIIKELTATIGIIPELSQTPDLAQLNENRMLREAQLERLELLTRINTAIKEKHYDHAVSLLCDSHLLSAETLPGMLGINTMTRGSGPGVPKVPVGLGRSSMFSSPRPKLVDPASSSGKAPPLPEVQQYKPYK